MDFIYLYTESKSIENEVSITRNKSQTRKLVSRNILNIESNDENGDYNELDKGILIHYTL